jgi:cytochrome c oxidase assembly protein subunit 11
LLPGESKEFPVSFFVDPSIVEDEDGKDVTAITLSYTFFNKGRPARDEYLRTHQASVRATSAAGAVER